MAHYRIYCYRLDDFYYFIESKLDELGNVVDSSFHINRGFYGWQIIDIDILNLDNSVNIRNYNTIIDYDDYTYNNFPGVRYPRWYNMVRGLVDLPNRGFIVRDFSMEAV